jgi:hypothetical protein
MTTAVDNFIADGFLMVRGAVAPEIVRECVASIEDQLRARGIDPRDPLHGCRRARRGNGNSRGVSPGCAPATCTVRGAWSVPRRRGASTLDLPPAKRSCNRPRWRRVRMPPLPRPSGDVAASWDATANARPTRDRPSPSVPAARGYACLRCRAGDPSRPAAVVELIGEVRR